MLSKTCKPLLTNPVHLRKQTFKGFLNTSDLVQLHDNIPYILLHNRCFHATHYSAQMIHVTLLLYLHVTIIYIIVENNLVIWSKVLKCIV